MNSSGREAIASRPESRFTPAPPHLSECERGVTKAGHTVPGRRTMHDEPRDATTKDRGRPHGRRRLWKTTSVSFHKRCDRTNGDSPGTNHRSVRTNRRSQENGKIRRAKENDRHTRSIRFRTNDRRHGPASAHRAPASASARRTKKQNESNSRAYASNC